METIKSYSRVFLAGLLLPYIWALGSYVAIALVVLLNLDRLDAVAALGRRTLDYLETYTWLRPVVAALRAYLSADTAHATHHHHPQPPSTTSPYGLNGYAMTNVPTV